jgi:hypothetical protein
MGKETVELVLPTPRGEIGAKRIFAPAARVADLSGKRIAMVHNKKAGADTFLAAVEELLKQKYPTATFVHGYDTEINLARDPAFYDEVAKKADVFIFGSGD